MALRKRIFSILVLVIFSLVIPGCAGGGSSDNGTGPKGSSLSPLQFNLPYVKGQLVVKLRSGSASSVTGILGSGVSSYDSIQGSNLYLVKLDDMTENEAYDILPANSDIVHVELNYKYGLLYTDEFESEPLYPSQTYLHENDYNTDINLKAAREIAVANNDVITAVIDTGCDIQHEDLQGVLVEGYDFVNNDSIPEDEHGHGSFCIGEIAAQINGIGTAGIASGIFSLHDRRIRIMPVKFLNASGSGSCWDSALAMRFAVDHGARVLSCSFGGACNSVAVEDAINYVLQKGAVIVAAGGNTGKDADASSANMIYPMGFPEGNILSLGSIEINGDMASYSTYGRTSVDAVECFFALEGGVRHHERDQYGCSPRRSNNRHDVYVER